MTRHYPALHNKLVDILEKIIAVPKCDNEVVENHLNEAYKAIYTSLEYLGRQETIDKLKEKLVRKDT